MNSQIVRITETDIKNIIKESVLSILKEDDTFNNDEPSNTHYAVSKNSGKILFSWDYSDIEPSELREFRRDYFLQDLIDFELNPKTIVIWTRKTCEKNGIDPKDNNNWANQEESLLDYKETPMMSEAFSDIYQWKHFDNDRDNENYYESFVVLDGTQAIIGNFDNYQDAVEYARELAMKYKNGTFEVYGCDKEGYSTDEEDNTLVYSTDEEFE